MVHSSTVKPTHSRKRQDKYGPSLETVFEAWGLNLEGLEKSCIVALAKFAYVDATNYKYLIFNDFLFGEVKDTYLEELNDIFEGINNNSIDYYDDQYRNDVYKETQKQYILDIIEMNKNYNESSKTLGTEFDYIKEMVKKILI